MQDCLVEDMVFFKKFCDVATLLIIHKAYRSERKVEKFLLCSGDLLEPIV
jgi:hypothetical protein